MDKTAIINRMALRYAETLALLCEAEAILEAQQKHLVERDARILELEAAVKANENVHRGIYAEAG